MFMEANWLGVWHGVHVTFVTKVAHDSSADRRHLDASYVRQHCIRHPHRQIQAHHLLASHLHTIGAGELFFWFL
jgi:D-alanyl-lipoteichoic acid acyltransferase DltB (MBOAT superfamily)